MRSTHFFSLVCLTAVLVNGHMTMTEPKPLRDPKNPNTKNGDHDYSAPLSKDGSNFPCKGYHKAMGTPEGTPVASWAAGSKQSFVIGGGAAHGGGSCQATFSEDGGATWRVTQSIIGGCPASGQPYTFTVPAEAKSGDALFAWTWFNKVGNREMYMNCASVTITGGTGAGLSSYPELFTANIGNGCSTAEGADVLFPNPGKDVVNTSQKTAPPTGSCAGAPPSSVKRQPTKAPTANPSPPVAVKPTTSAPAQVTIVTPPIDDDDDDVVVTPTGVVSKGPSPPTTAAPSFTSISKGKCRCECNGRVFSVGEF
ncbi:hypothetical protein HOY80DRAFT_895516 [Tuber brumale]|nr:hypothetical protein HOY80DRAFT_895516 [Tuber brumale]